MISVYWDSVRIGSGESLVVMACRPCPGPPQLRPFRITNVGPCDIFLTNKNQIDLQSGKVQIEEMDAAP